uniref:Uncharacterized protein n=1 Tax=Anopheles albimanus TaxID=7167 RepID=A0A182FYA9_ANOAL
TLAQADATIIRCFDAVLISAVSACELPKCFHTLTHAEYYSVIQCDSVSASKSYSRER